MVSFKPFLFVRMCRKSVVFPLPKKVPMVNQNDDNGTAETSVLFDNESMGPEEEEEPESLKTHVNNNDDTKAVHVIMGHTWHDDKLFLQVEFVTGETHDIKFSLLQDDKPIMCVKCKLNNDIDSFCDTAPFQQHSCWGWVTLYGLR